MRLLDAVPAQSNEQPRRLRPNSENTNASTAGHATPAPRLALYHRPGAVVLLDDDPDFLDMLAFALPAQWNVRSFLSPQSCVNSLQQEPPRWEADFWAQQKIIESWHNGVPLIPQILQYWATIPQRYELTKVCVVDHLMPGMTGLDVLEELVESPPHRVLLTGAFDEGLATDAFNRGLIDQFVAKQTDQMSAHLIAVIQRLLNRPHPRLHQIWSATLGPEQLALLRERSVAADLSEFAGKTFAEWIVIGEPFGILGINEAGFASWVQLEPTSELNGLAEIAEQNGVSKTDVAHIRAGHCVYDVELQQVLDRRRPPTVTPAFYVGTAGTLLAAIHSIAADIVPPRSLSYRNWLENQGKRLPGRF